MKMIVGLGNPGKPYQNNRHNVGFQCVDLLACNHGLTFDIKRAKARVALGNIRLTGVSGTGDSQAVPDLESPPPLASASIVPHTTVVHVLLVKPQTFMNVVGGSVANLARFYKVDPDDMLLIYDDLDLPLGGLRLRPEGGSGGHNGLKSIIQQLGTNQFPRLRVGIDRPPGRMDPADYVLQDFTNAQEEIMGQARHKAVAACECWLLLGIEAAMNAFN